MPSPFFKFDADYVNKPFFFSAQQNVSLEKIKSLLSISLCVKELEVH